MNASNFHTRADTDTATAAQELDVLPYINALIDARWWIVLSAVVLAVLVGLWSSTIPYRYESSAKVSVVDIEDPGGVSPDDRRASEVLTLVEHGFVMGTTRDNYDAVMLARLRSRDFTVRFLEQFNVYRHFYPEQWDAQKGAWKGDFSPDRGEAVTRFRDEMSSVTVDEETDIITVAMRWHDPVVARDLANQYVEAFNEFIRERTRDEVERKQAFLKAELSRSDVVDMQQSIYRLIEAQTAIAMLVSARDEYALEVIDPAAIPYKSFTMSRKKKTAAAFIAGALLATFAVLALKLLASMIATVRAYREAHAPRHASEMQKETGDN